METLIAQFQEIFADEEKMRTFLMMALVLSAGSLVFGFIGRFAFGKKSVLNQSVSSAIGILFIYAVTILLTGLGMDLKYFISPLPFISMLDGSVFLYPVMDFEYVSLCGELLNMIILAFVVNIVNRWMPHGKHLITWLFFRALSVALGMAAFTLTNMLLIPLLPEGFITWAPVILLGLLVIMLLAGALKILIGALLVTVNPLIGFLYTFFFANIVGKMLARAMLTALLIAALIAALSFIGITVILIGQATLIACIPIMLLLLILWYVVGKLL